MKQVKYIFKPNEYPKSKPFISLFLLAEFCLPAVFMPYKTHNNVFNPKAHQYFHPIGQFSEYFACVYDESLLKNHSFIQKDTRIIV
jgi:hypothetical protein